MIRLALRNLGVILCSATAAICLTPEVSRGAVIISDFSVDAESWTTTGGTQSHQSAGGNPGGHLRLTDSFVGINPPYFLTAPSKFLGDLTGVDTFDGGTLAFSAIRFAGSDSSGNFSGVVTISSSSDSATRDLATSGYSNSWEDYTAPLTASAWGKSQTDWTNILSAVTSITIVMDENDVVGGVTPDETGFDTFVLASASVPEPASGLLAGLAAIQGAVVLQWRRRRQKKAAQAAQTTAV